MANTLTIKQSARYFNLIVQGNFFFKKPKTPNATTAPPPQEKGKKKKGKKKKQKKNEMNFTPTNRPPPKLPKISVVNKSQNEEEAFELRSQVEEIYQYWSVCL